MRIQLLVLLLSAWPFLLLKAQLPPVERQLSPWQADTFCIGPQYLEVSLFSVSANQSTDFLILPESNCLLIRGLEEGQDTALLEGCKADRTCDTFALYVEVANLFEKPEARPDTARLRLRESRSISVLQNDLPKQDSFALSTVVPPEFGKATWQWDYSLRYEAPDDACGFLDTVVYQLCNALGCDTASVAVEIQCPDVKVYNAFSPNADGVHDVFVIEGLEYYPENLLQIFDPQGRKVYEKRRYRSDWDGDIQEDKRLPSGTYYYVLQLNSPLQPEPLKGYLEIRR